jgi:hypothetical protein
MEKRSGSVGLFDLLLPQILMLITLTLQIPLIIVAVLEAVYLLCLLLVFTVGVNNVSRIYADENFIHISFDNGAYNRFFNTPYVIEGQYR